MSRARIISLIIVAVVLLGFAAAAFFVLRQPATKAPVTPQPSTSPTPSASVYPPPPSDESPSAPSWPTANYEKAYAGAAASSPLLTAIRVGSHPSEGYDRIAFDFASAGAPGYRVQYVAQAVRDGSGQPVTLPGNAVLQIVFTPAAAHTEAGQSSVASPPINPVNTGYSQLRSYVLNGDFEGQVSIALGLAGKTGFRVGEINRGNNAWTVYVDVRR